VWLLVINYWTIVLLLLDYWQTVIGQLLIGVIIIGIDDQLWRPVEGPVEAKTQPSPGQPDRPRPGPSPDGQTAGPANDGPAQPASPADGLTDRPSWPRPSPVTRCDRRRTVIGNWWTGPAGIVIIIDPGRRRTDWQQLWWLWRTDPMIEPRLTHYCYYCWSWPSLTSQAVIEDDRPSPVTQLLSGLVVMLIVVIVGSYCSCCWPCWYLLLVVGGWPIYCYYWFDC